MTFITREGRGMTLHPTTPAAQARAEAYRLRLQIACRPRLPQLPGGRPGVIRAAPARDLPELRRDRGATCGSASEARGPPGCCDLRRAAAVRARRRPGSRCRARRPARRAPRHFAGSSSPLRVVRPGAPSSPPSRPAGPRRRRSAMTDASASTSTRTRRSTPSPPRCAPRAARAAPQPVRLDAQGIGGLERLDGRVERVAHRHVDRRGAVRGRARRPGRRRASRSR